MKSVNVLFVALAATMLISCVDERKDAVYEAETQADKIETALSEAVLLLNPNFYYESVEAITWLRNYCLHEHVADVSALGTHIMNITEGWTTEMESDEIKTVISIYELSELTGKFCFVESEEEGGKATWTAENANDLEITWPSKDGISTTLTLKVKDGSTKFLVEGYSSSGVVENTYLVAPKHISAKLVKGGRTLSTASIVASFKLAEEDCITSTDRLNFSINLNVEDYQFKFSRCMLSPKNSKVSGKVSRNNELIAKASATLKGMVWDDETHAPTTFGTADFNADVRGKVQMSGAVDIDGFVACINKEVSTTAEFVKLAEEMNDALNLAFYFDGFKTPQSHLVFKADEKYGGVDSYLMTYEGEEVEFESERFGYCLEILGYTFEHIGVYECPDCRIPR